MSVASPQQRVHARFPRVRILGSGRASMGRRTSINREMIGDRGEAIGKNSHALLDRGSISRVPAQLPPAALSCCPQRIVYCKKNASPNWRVDQPIPNMSAQFYRSSHQSGKKHKNPTKTN